MEYKEYEEKFTAKALKATYSAEDIQTCLNYAKPLIERNLPVIYNTTHLASLVGYNTTYLLRVAANTKYFYREFPIQKKNGSTRHISEPLPSLKEIQRWILEELLYFVESSKYAKAYIPKMTIKQNLVFHRKTPLVLKLDIVDFFTSIKSDSIRKLFILLGYSHSLANLFSKICCLNNQLPQGAPTSAYLSNLYLKDFDESVGAFCSHRKIRYTRYADDLTFSGEFDPELIKKFVNDSLDHLKLKLNVDKTQLMKKGDRQIVTGVVVNEKLQIERSKRKELRQIIHYIKIFGIQDHCKKIGNEKDNYLEHLIGRINYVLFINPDDHEFISYKDFLYGLKYPETTIDD